jgi:ELWxxDGT repeat protein
MDNPLKCLPVIAVIAGTLAAQNLQLAVDVNRVASPFGSFPDAGTPDDFVVAGALAAFRATHPLSGNEVWVTDGTAAGTTLLRDVVPGVGSSTPRRLAIPVRHEVRAAVIGGSLRVFFAAWTYSGGNEAWISDGTAAGTQLLLDVNPGPEGSDPSDFTPFNGKMYFSAFEPATGSELWESDGTVSGTRVAAEVFPGPTSGGPRNLHVVAGGNLLLFQGLSGSIGDDLYAFDPASRRTTRLAAIGSDNYFGPKDFVNIGSLTLFVAASATAGQELWVTDGTVAGTNVIDIAPGPSASSPRLDDAVVIGSTLYFSATTAAFGTELWASDGTVAGTQLVADIVPGTGSSMPGSFASLGGQLVFAAETPGTGREPWAVVGGAPTLVADLQPGAAGSNPSQFEFTGSQVILAATIGGTTGLYRFGGGPITLLAATSVDGLTPFVGGQFLFRGDGGQGSEPWITDGTIAGTRMIFDIGLGSRTASSSPLNVRVTKDGALFFSATDGQTGHEPWVWRRGSAPRQLADITPGPLDSFPSLVAQSERWSLLSANRLGLGQEPYAWNHATGTVVLLRDINPGVAGSYPFAGAAIGGNIVFTAQDPVNGAELWLSDGTPGGTVLLLDITPGGSSGSPGYFTPLRNRVLFVAQTPATGLELWITDGTAAGTMMLVDLAPGPTGSSPILEAEFDGAVWFSATTPQFGRELWRTDGTVGGTTLAVDLIAGATGSFPREAVRLGNRLAFIARTPATGYELFVTDGTANGTVLVRDIRPGPASGCSSSIPVAAGSRLFLRADDGVSGLELWVSDLTTAGTQLVKDLEPASPSGSLNGDPIAVGERVYFGASTFDLPNSAWVSDGTVQGTFPLGLGTNSSVFEGVSLDGVFYAPLFDLVGGDEIVAIRDPGAMVEDLGDRCASNWSSLDATPPVLGGTMRVEGFGAPPGSVGVTAAAFAAPRQLLPGIVAPGCWSRAVPFDVVLPVTATQTWRIPIPVPAAPTLSGVGFVMQTFYLQSQNPLLEPSNAIRVTIGR